MYQNTIRMLCDEFGSVGIMIQQPNPSKSYSIPRPSVCLLVYSEKLSVSLSLRRQAVPSSASSPISKHLPQGWIHCRIQRRAAPYSAPAYWTITQGEKKRKVHEIDVQQTDFLSPHHFSPGENLAYVCCFLVRWRRPDETPAAISIRHQML